MWNIRYLTLLYLAILLFGTVFPFGSRLSYTLSNNYVFQIRWDYLIHVILYLPMPVLLGLAFSKRSGGATSNTSTEGSFGYSIGKSPFLYWLLVVGGSLVLTFFYEALQLLIPYRYFNINDMVSNVVGVFLGLILLVSFSSTLWRIQARIFPGSSR